MDYFCAIAAVLVALIAGVVRIASPRKRVFAGCCSGVLITAFYIYHVHYLAFVHFSYSYNMQANVTAGLVNAAAWLIWSYCVRREQPYVWKAAVTIIAALLLVCLELGDFPPIWWTFDAHSLWHLGTVPLQFMWYQFLVDDCQYMLKQKHSTGAGQKKEC